MIDYLLETKVIKEAHCCHFVIEIRIIRFNIEI
jgi:hypothetical protein